MAPVQPPRALGPVDWVLLVVGPVALVARRRHPVLVLWVTLATTLAPSGTGLTHVSFIVAFFVAATAGKRYPAWLALALTFVWTIWLAPLIYGYAVPANDALALAGWLLAVAIAAEATRIRAERAAATRASRQLDQRRQPERGAAADRQGPARRDRPQHLAHQRPGQHGA